MRDTMYGGMKYATSGFYACERDSMFCARCGAPVPESARFCARCGSPANPAPPQAAAPAALPVGSVPPGAERYVGGFVSPNLHLRGRGLSSLGYGVYVTDRRLIGVNSKRGLLAGLAAVGGVTGIAFALAGSTDDSAKAIAELETKKDFDVPKADVLGLEVRRPHGLTVGYLDITRTSGERIRITIADKPEFESVRRLMQTFCPERLSADP